MHFALTSLFLIWIKVLNVFCDDTMTENHLNVDERQFIALGGIRDLLTKLLNVTVNQGVHGTDFGNVMDAINRTHYDSKSLVTSITSTRTALKEMSVIGKEAVNELSAVKYAMTNLTEVLAKVMLQASHKPQAPYADNLVIREETVLSFVPCEPPYFKVLGIRGTECYNVHAEKLKWEAARKMCLSEGSDLAQPDDLEALWRYLNQNGMAGDYWMGGTDEEREGEWHWLSGEPINGPWHNNQPQGDGDCLDFLATKEAPVLNDYICHNAQAFICQRYTTA